jgi:MFS transporter, putative metabolite:H+ symporter
MSEAALTPDKEMSARQPSHAGARLDRLPICSFHYRLLMLIGIGLLIDSFDIYIQGAILAELVRTHLSNPIRNAQFLSTTFAGLALGTLITGWAGDRWGRRTIYRMNLLLFGLATLMAAFAPTFSVLLICRFVAGLGLGGEVMTCYVCLAEFVPASQRGRWQGLLAFVSSLGLPLSALASWAIIPRFGWRPVFMVVGGLALAAWIYQRNIPESPRWYEVRNRHAEAGETIRKIEEEVERATRLPLPHLTVGAVQSHGGPSSWRMMFRGRMRRRMMLAIALMVCINIVVYSATGWVPTMLVERGFSISSVLRITSLMQLGTLPGSLIGAWIIDPWGRKLSLISFSLGAGFMFVVYSVSNIPATLVLSGFALYVLLYALVAMIFATYVPELFPTRMRLTGCGISSGSGRLANVAAPFVITGLLRSAGPRSIYYACSLVLLFQALAVLILGEETRDRSLEEIEDLNSRPLRPV